MRGLQGRSRVFWLWITPARGLPFKQTSRRRKLRSRSERNAERELDWSLPAPWCLCSLGKHELTAAGWRLCDVHLCDFCRFEEQPVQSISDSGSGGRLGGGGGLGGFWPGRVGGLGFGIGLGPNRIRLVVRSSVYSALVVWAFQPASRSRSEHNLRASM